MWTSEGEKTDEEVGGGSLEGETVGMELNAQMVGDPPRPLPPVVCQHQYAHRSTNVFLHSCY